MRRFRRCPLAAPYLTPDDIAGGRPVADPAQLVAGRSPGDLLSYEEITAPGDPAFPSGARARQVDSVSTGRDNTDLTVVRGAVIAPAETARLAHAADDPHAGRLVAWEHGTLGLTSRCMPLEDPASLIWGPTPWGIGAICWGSDATGDYREGRPEDGILAGMIDEGWIVTATDYYVDRWGGDGLQPYAIGKIEAANTIDNMRATHQLLREVLPGYALERHDVVPWGHSQGGHAAIWTGQLLEPYLRATATPNDPGLALAGVALEAPGSTFIMRPGMQPGAERGYGHFDWLANARLELTGVPEPIPVAPFFLAYVFASWSRHAQQGSPNPEEMPAFPDTGPLEVTAVVRPDEIETVERISQRCWVDGAAVAELVAPYRDKPFLTAEVSEGEVVDGFQHGRFDASAANPPNRAIANWCEWIAYNLPGPVGANDFARVPTRDGELMPVMISAGSGDTVVHCITPAGAEDRIPAARHCLPVALFDALEEAYLQNGEPRGHLTLNVWHPRNGVTSADHSDIRGLNAAAGPADLRFAGSPLHRFITAAFERKLAPGISRVLVNGGNWSGSRAGPRAATAVPRDRLRTCNTRVTL